MRLVYDRMACGGWFQCVQKWDDFEMNLPEGKADLRESQDRGDGTFVREVPDAAVEKAKAAAESCPAEAIFLYDDDGEQIVP
ncbi:MAG: ferredoxin [Halobacteriales archaeon]|nr:ferredoxin [Halobacteriales archaeon]